jgi:hypothetical protein
MKFRYGGDINIFIYEDNFFEVDRWGNVWCVSEDTAVALGTEIEEACKLWRRAHWDSMPIYEFLNGVFGE